MKIGMLSADWGDYHESSPGGCTNIRLITPAKALDKCGIEVSVGEFGWRDEPKTGEPGVCAEGRRRQEERRLGTGRIGIQSRFKKTRIRRSTP